MKEIAVSDRYNWFELITLFLFNGVVMMSIETHIGRLFSYGFRPLFLLSVGAGIALVLWWVGVLSGHLSAPNVIVSIIDWHAHEMLFGFVGSAIGGFLLTAVANWTGRPAVQGIRLALIVCCWLLARVVVTLDMGLSNTLVMLIDSSYWMALTFFMAWEVIAVKNYRNLKIVGILAGFTLLNLGYHASAVFDLSWDSAQIAIRATVVLVCVLISVIGGRIIPAFTANWIRMNLGPEASRPPMATNFDRLVVAATVLLLPFWSVIPTHPVTAWLALVTGCLHLLRVSRWHVELIWREPLLLILHTGYAWLGIGFICLGVGYLFDIFPATAGVHALTVGAMASLILGVSSRAAMGHTNRALTAYPLLSASFVLINLAAVARLGAGMIASNTLIWISAGCWLLALLLFAIKFAPILLGPTPLLRNGL